MQRICKWAMRLSMIQSGEKWSNSVSARLGKQVYLTLNRLSIKSFLFRIPSICFLWFLIIFNKDYFLSRLKFVVEMNSFLYLSSKAIYLQCETVLQTRMLWFFNLPCSIREQHAFDSTWTTRFLKDSIILCSQLTAYLIIPWYVLKEL